MKTVSATPWNTCIIYSFLTVHYALTLTRICIVLITKTQRQVRQPYTHKQSHTDHLHIMIAFLSLNSVLKDLTWSPLTVKALFKWWRFTCHWVWKRSDPHSVRATHRSGGPFDYHSLYSNQFCEGIRQCSVFTLRKFKVTDGTHCSGEIQYDSTVATRRQNLRKKYGIQWHYQSCFESWN